MTEYAKQWPKIIHHHRTWVDAYENGWAQLRAVMVDGDSMADTLLWALYCARYAWRRWPIEKTLDYVYTKGNSGFDQRSLLPWLELALYRLTGDRGRLRRIYPQPETVAVEEANGDQLVRWVHGRARTEIAHLLDHSPRADVQFIHRMDLSAALKSLSVPPVVEDERAVWVQNCLLLLWLLRAEQEGDAHQRLAQSVAAFCVERPALHRYLPPLLLDGVLGYQPDAEERTLTWWLYADPPIGVEGYPLAHTSVSLHAKQEERAGTLLSIQTNAPLTLEIITPARSYLEVLAAGQHDLVLTVLDRTDVR